MTNFTIPEEKIHHAAYDACMTPMQPNGEPEPEHAYYDGFMHGVRWAMDQINLMTLQQNPETILHPERPTDLK